MQIQIYLTDPRGAEEELSAPEGYTLLQAAQDAGLDGLVAECAGNCACATCHCYVEFVPDQALSEPSHEEQQMLDFVAAPREENSRLACQIIINSHMQGMRVRIAERQF